MGPVINFGGKQDDLRTNYSWIIQVEYPDCTVASECTEREYNSVTAAKYPKALKVWRIIGISPEVYVSKEEIH